MISFEQYLIENDESRYRLAELLNAMGESVHPDDFNAIGAALLKLTQLHGREFVFSVVRAAHPDRELIVEAEAFMNGRNDVDRMVNKGITEFMMLSPWVKIPVLSILIALLVKTLISGFIKAK